MREVNKLDPFDSTPEEITAALRADGIDTGCWTVALGNDAALQLTLHQDGTCVMTAETFAFENEETEGPTDNGKAEMRCQGSWVRGDDGLSVLLQLQQAVETGENVSRESLPLRATDVPAHAAHVTGKLRWESATFLVFAMGGREVLFDPPGGWFCTTDSCNTHSVYGAPEYNVCNS